MKMNPRWERALLVCPPAISVVVIALGLRIGASHDARAARVYGAPPASGQHGLAWTVALMREDRGVKEPVPNEPLRVSVTQQGGHGATWEGMTNADGVAEAWLALEGVAPGERLAAQVVAARTGEDFAHGMVTVPPQRTDSIDERTPTFLAANRRAGTIALDALVIGRALAAEFPSRVLVRATDAATGAALGNVRITVEPEPGLEVATPTARTCDNGWAEVAMTARAHVVGASFRAEEGKGKNARAGEWFGAIPVAGGAFSVSLPEAGGSLTVRSPSPRPVAYVEIDDEKGRARGYALDLKVDGSGMRSASIPFPTDAPEKGFVIASGEAHGAENLSGATLAFPYAPPAAACELRPTLARMTARVFPRPVVLDGLGPVHMVAARARARGLRLAVWTVLLSALVEGLLLLRHAKRGRIGFARLPPELIEGRVGSVAVGLGIGLLGFALLAALLLRSAS
ncbi:hypothetical protein LVJ94_46885 [Pendulispora rubella]|uniref:Carboxypeptidase regulatory-like domain-containing protein n=1 Tax=Pendulispora rubella TaxID=2741070 RepID=A0ABZ2L0E7_9BACT